MKLRILSPSVAICHVLIIFILLHIILMLVLSSTPPVSRDALTHHLAVPKLYVEKGRVYEIPHIPFSYYPMNLDLLYTLPLILKKDFFAKYIHFLFAVLTAYLIFRYLKERVGKLFALLGPLFFLSIPIIVKLSITVYVDLGVIFFSTASMLALLKWSHHDFKNRYLIWAGVSCGFALGTKYNALIIFLILTIAVTALRIKLDKTTHLQKKAVVSTCIFVLTALLIFSPWMIRNFIWTNNPLYPLYQNVFKKSAISDFSQKEKKEPLAANESWQPFKLRSIIYKEHFIEILSIPIRIFFEGEDDDPKRFDGKLTPFLLLFLVVSLFIKTTPYLSRAEKYTLVLFSIFVVLIVFFKNDMRIRYVSPIIPPLVILSTIVMKKWYDISYRHSKKQMGLISRIGLTGLIFSMFLYNGNYIIDQFKIVQPMDYLTSKRSRADYIQKYRSEYGCASYANKKIAKNSKLLGIFMGNRSYYFDQEIRFDFFMIKKNIQSFYSEKKMYEELKKENYTHLMVRFDLFKKWAGDQFNAQGLSVLNAFFNDYTKPLYIHGGFGLYALQ